MKTFKAISMLLLIVTLLSTFGAGVCAADDFPSLELRLATDSETRIVGEIVPAILEMTNKGTKDAPRWSCISPGALEEFQFRMADSEGNQLKKGETHMSKPPVPIMRNPLKPGQTSVYYNVFIPGCFFEHNDPGVFPLPGEYKIWCEYIPEIRKRPDAPVVAKSNVLTFHVEPLDIVAVKSIETEFLDLGYDTPHKKKTTFKVFAHKGSQSYRLYWEKAFFPPFQISDNVIPEMFDMKVDGYGNTHVWYQTTDGAFLYYIRRNFTEPPNLSRMPLPEGYLPEPLLPENKENNWEILDVPAGYLPAFKTAEDKVEIEYVPAPPEDTDGEEPRLPPPVRVPPPEPPGREEPEKDETDREPDAGHWIVIGIVALTAVVLAAVLLKKRK